MSWANFCTDVTCNTLVFTKGASSTCRFFHVGRKIVVVVHGDDLFSEGVAEALSWMDAEMREHLELKTYVLAPDAGKAQVREVRLLSWILRRVAHGFSWEAGRCRTCRARNSTIEALERFQCLC